MLKRLLVATAAAGAILIGPFASMASAESVPVPVIGCNDDGKCGTGVCWADLDNGGKHTHCRTMRDFNDGNTGDPDASTSANDIDRFDSRFTVELTEAFAIFLGYRHYEAELDPASSSEKNDHSVSEQPDPAGSPPDNTPTQPDNIPERPDHKPGQPDNKPGQPDTRPEPGHSGDPQPTPSGSHDLSAEPAPAEFEAGGEIPILVSH